MPSGSGSGGGGGDASARAVPPPVSFAALPTLASVQIGGAMYELVLNMAYGGAEQKLHAVDALMGVRGGVSSSKLLAMLDEVAALMLEVLERGKVQWSRVPPRVATICRTVVMRAARIDQSACRPAVAKLVPPLARAYEEFGWTDDAIDAYQIAVRMAQRLPAEHAAVLVSEASLRLGRLYARMGRAADAVRTLQAVDCRVNGLSGAQRVSTGVAKWCTLARVYTQLGRHAEAREALRSWSEYALTKKGAICAGCEKEDLLEASAALAAQLARDGDYVAAACVLEKPFTPLEGIVEMVMGDSHAAWVRCRLACAEQYLAFGSASLAIDVCVELDELCDEVGNHELYLADVIALRGRARRMRKLRPRALESAEREVAVREQQQGSASAATAAALCSRGRAQLKLGRADEAAQSLAKAHETLLLHGARVESLTSFEVELLRGDVHRVAGRHSEALECFKRAQGIAARVEGDGGAEYARALCRIAKVHFACGRTTDAAACFDEALEARTRVHGVMSPRVTSSIRTGTRGSNERAGSDIAATIGALRLQCVNTGVDKSATTSRRDKIKMLLEFAKAK